MLKPFYNKKKNIDDRLVPAVTAADAGKVLGVTEDGKIAAVEGGGESLWFPIYVGYVEDDIVFSETFNDIKAAYTAGKIPILFDKAIDSLSLYTMQSITNELIIFVRFGVEVSNTQTDAVLITDRLLLNPDETVENQYWQITVNKK